VRVSAGQPLPPSCGKLRRSLSKQAVRDLVDLLGWAQNTGNMGNLFFGDPVIPNLVAGKPSLLAAYVDDPL
jgi:hypothetical protein